MTARLSNKYEFAPSPANYSSFFSRHEQGIIETDSASRTILCADPLAVPPPCGVNLFFGFFFDGTNNNLKRDLPNQSHSNVARLYRAYPGQAFGSQSGDVSWPDTEQNKSHFQKHACQHSFSFSALYDGQPNTAPRT